MVVQRAGPGPFEEGRVGSGRAASWPQALVLLGSTTLFLGPFLVETSLYSHLLMQRTGTDHEKRTANRKTQNRRVTQGISSQTTGHTNVETCRQKFQWGQPGFASSWHNRGINTNVIWFILPRGWRQSSYFLVHLGKCLERSSGWGPETNSFFENMTFCRRWPCICCFEMV